MKALPAPPESLFMSANRKRKLYKGKRLVGESTVSTGKPGFSTPPEAILFCQKPRPRLNDIRRLRG